MYRLNILAALMLLCVLSACSGAGQGTDLPAAGNQSSLSPVEQGSKLQERGDVLAEAETSSPAKVTLVSEEFARRMRMPDTSILETLEFPADDVLGKLPSVVGTDSLLGRESFMFSSGKASNVGDSKRLLSGSGTAWVMYRFQGYDFHKDPGTISVHLANENYAGSDPGFVLAIANYETGRWQMLGQTQVQDLYIKSLVVADHYRSPNSNIFIAAILPTGQELDIVQVELDYNEVTWLNVEVDSEAGWTPGVEFLPNGNIFLAYADFNAGLPLAAVLDRSLDPGDQANWSIGDMNSIGKGIGLGQDVTIGPAGTPRISLVYTAIGSSLVNTLIGFTAYYDEGANNEAGFFNFEIGQIGEGAWMDLAGSSSVDFNSAGGKYGLATHFYNLAQPDSQNGACRYRQFNLVESDPPEEYQIETAGGLTAPGYWFPRVGFSPQENIMYFANNGGFLTQINPGTPDTLTDIFSETSSHDIGALAINDNAGTGEETFGFVHKFFELDNDPAGPEILRYVPLLANLNLTGAGIQTVDNFPASPDDFLADFNQVDFTPDGRPAIAYTRDDGSNISIWYAYWDGAAWQKEQVSAQSISKYQSNLRIWLDMAIDENGIAGICWNRALADDDSKLMFAIRGS